MTLEELSIEYAHTARQVYTRMAHLRRLEKLATHPKERHELHRRILALQPLYRDAREISVITANYYKPRRARYDNYVQTSNLTPQPQPSAPISAPCTGSAPDATPTADDDLVL